MLSARKQKSEPMISVQTQIEIAGDLNLASISQELDRMSIPKEILKSATVKLQEELMDDLCGKKYARNPDRKFCRGGTKNRTLQTRHGKVGFRLAKVHDLESDCYFSPLLLYFGIRPRQRIVDDLVLECAELATYLTYRDSEMVIENLTNAEVFQVQDS